MTKPQGNGLAGVGARREDLRGLTVPGGGIDDGTAVRGETREVDPAAPEGELLEGGGGADSRWRGRPRGPPRPRPGRQGPRCALSGRGAGARPRGSSATIPRDPAAVVGEARRASSAKERSCADWKRSSRSLRKHRRTTCSRGAGTGPAGATISGGSRVSRRGQGVGTGVGEEGPRSRHHLVEHRAHGEEVRPRVDRLAARLLRRQIAEGAYEDAGSGEGFARSGQRPGARPVGAGELGDPEIEDLEVPAVPGHEQVFRLQVAMHDPVRVRGGQPLADLDRELEGLARGDGPALEALPQGQPLEDLGDHEEGAHSRRPCRRGTRCWDGSGRPGPGPPAGSASGRRGFAGAGGDDLDRHVALEAVVARPIDLGHAARSR